MYRVKHLTMLDLDEMILPVSTSNWPDMLASLEKKGNYASYTFSNTFFAVQVNTTNKDISMCFWPFPKYFGRLKRLPWPCSENKTKMMTIVKPDLVPASCIWYLRAFSKRQQGVPGARQCGYHGSLLCAWFPCRVVCLRGRSGGYNCCQVSAEGDGTDEWCMRNTFKHSVLRLAV